MREQEKKAQLEERFTNYVQSMIPFSGDWKMVRKTAKEKKDELTMLVHSVKVDLDKIKKRCKELGGNVLARQGIVSCGNVILEILGTIHKEEDK